MMAILFYLRSKIHFDLENSIVYFAMTISNDYSIPSFRSIYTHSYFRINQPNQILINRIIKNWRLIYTLNHGLLQYVK